ncbi:Transcription factor [Penicillium taxi]|uniref:Transcription factor n=1 Tax=Penicillium taxi TaxID=168475 RepID=UPI0025450005|nr:Transcription factor [Penicillium taxi]KAJ5907939.1 Transcription factor [Penicillium taxi]
MPSVATIHRRNVYSKDVYTFYPVLIIGAGESGVAMGCRLKEVLGTDQFRIFERQSGVGGTWWINRYPGVACDIPALFYSFSFAPKKNWSTIHPPGSEIALYISDVCEHYGIMDKIQFHTDIRQIRWIEEDEEWEIILAHLVPGTGDLSQYERDQLAAKEGSHSVYITTEKVRAKVVVSGVGSLVEPRTWPKDIPGIEDFQGEIVHTARWNPNIDFNNKDVIVLGSGCSAAQVVPELVKPEFNARSVTQFMRTPPWVQPDLMTPGQVDWWKRWMPTLMTNVPGLLSLLRRTSFFLSEEIYFAIFPKTAYAALRRPMLEKKFLDHMRQVAPKEYHEILTPNYPLGCKRRIIDSTWYRSLNEPNVELTTSPLTHIFARSVAMGPGCYYPPGKEDSVIKRKEIPADVIVLGNGFATNQYLHPIKVYGRGNRAMDDIWEERGGAQAYLGIAMDQFPNFFMLFGPNTATGHTSVIFTTENAINYSLNFIKPILEGHVNTYEIREDAQLTWTQRVQDKLQDTVFGRGSCTSWYITSGGWNSSTYPWSQIHYWYWCKFPVWRHWTAKLTRKGRTLRRVNTAVRISSVIGILVGLIWLRGNLQHRDQILQTLQAGKDFIVKRFIS